MAAADYAEGKRKQPPPELTFAYLTKSWGSPYGNGWLNWPAGLPQRMTAAYNIAQAFQMYHQFVNRKGWVDANQHIFEQVTMVWNMRKERGLHYMTGEPLQNGSK